MKKAIFLFLYFNLIGGFFIDLRAQELKLNLEAEIPISKGLRDSLQLQESYNDFQSIRQKTDTLFLTLVQMGFIDARLQNLKQENDSTYLAQFHLGKKQQQIKIYYSEADFTKREIHKISSNVNDGYFWVPIEKFPKVMEQLTAIQNKKGNAFARAKLTEIEKNPNDELSATLYMDKGTIRTLDSIAIKGYEKFPKSFLKYYAGIKKGKVFDKQKLVEQNENLSSLGFVSSTKPPEALFRKDSTIVYLYLEKKNNNQFDGILGFATDEETQKVQFNGYLNLELNNNLNFGEQLLLSYRADGNEQIQFRTKISAPYLFSTPFGISGELNILKRDSSFVSTEQQLRTNYQINPTSQTYLGYRGFDSSNLLDNTMAGTPIEDFESKFLIGGISYIKPHNNRLFPIKSFLSIDAGVGSRKGKSQNSVQYQLEARGNNIFRLNKKNSLFVQISASVLFSDNYLTNELFRFGGINSIRGFDENSIDASLFSVINTEYRFQFTDEVFIHSITDLGYFENQTLSIKEKLYSFGFGLGLVTKPGLFRFIVANGTVENQDFSLSNLKIHISVSSRF